jgi:hypothetical protein
MVMAADGLVGVIHVPAHKYGNITTRIGRNEDRIGERGKDMSQGAQFHVQTLVYRRFYGPFGTELFSILVASCICTPDQREGDWTAFRAFCLLLSPNLFQAFVDPGFGV